MKVNKIVKVRKAAKKEEILIKPITEQAEKISKLEETQKAETMSI